MILAVLSGKGGTGKTFVSVNLATVSDNSIYLDCDVEEPDGHIFFKTERTSSNSVYKSFPIFNERKCTSCKKCVEFCAFNALALVGKKPIVFQEVCHDCGGCELVCPSQAITMGKKSIGKIDWGTHNNTTQIQTKTTIVSGTLAIGEASGIPVINSVIQKGISLTKTNSSSFSNQTIIIDCPPGSSCAVMESIQLADFCVLVTEPTPFGLHNMKMVYELTCLMKKNCGVIINKATNNNIIENYCKQEKLPILEQIPFDKTIAKLNSLGKILSEENIVYQKLFSSILKKISHEVNNIKKEEQ